MQMLHWTWCPDLSRKPSVLHSHTPQFRQHTVDQTLKAKLADRDTELRARSLEHRAERARASP
jgi:hypothetical protein